MSTLPKWLDDLSFAIWCGMPPNQYGHITQFQATVASEYVETHNHTWVPHLLAISRLKRLLAIVPATNTGLRKCVDVVLSYHSSMLGEHPHDVSAAVALAKVYAKQKVSHLEHCVAESALYSLSTAPHDQVVSAVMAADAFQTLSPEQGMAEYVKQAEDLLYNLKVSE